MDNAALFELFKKQSAKIGIGLLLFAGLHLEGVRTFEHPEDLLGQKRLANTCATFDEDVFANEQRKKDLLDRFFAVDHSLLNEFDRLFKRRNQLRRIDGSA